MGKQNPLLARHQAEKQKCFQVGCDMTSQQFFDYMCIVLNNPKIVGKDVHGAARLKKIMEGIKELDKEYSEAWCGGEESDWYQEQLDGALKRIFGEIAPFRERYPYLRDTDYTKPFKKKGDRK